MQHYQRSSQGTPEDYQLSHQAPIYSNTQISINNRGAPKINDPPYTTSNSDIPDIDIDYLFDTGSILPKPKQLFGLQGSNPFANPIDNRYNLYKPNNNSKIPILYNNKSIPATGNLIPTNTSNSTVKPKMQLSYNNKSIPATGNNSLEKNSTSNSTIKPKMKILYNNKSIPATGNNSSEKNSTSNSTVEQNKQMILWRKKTIIRDD
jgi:hypothetical protein